MEFLKAENYPDSSMKLGFIEDSSFGRRRFYIFIDGVPNPTVFKFDENWQLLKFYSRTPDPDISIRELTRIVTDFVPFCSRVVDGMEAFLGIDLGTGKRLNPPERIYAGVCAISGSALPTALIRKTVEVVLT